MSLPRRAPPTAPARRGWCPGLARPMPTGDGLLARIHPPLGILSLAQARAVAAGARLFGNGHLDLTARANLQVRGVTQATREPLARLLEAVGLGDVRDDGGPQRLTLTSPLAGRDPAEVIDVPGLARAIETAGRAVSGLPAKTLVVIEGRPGMALPEADFLVRALAPGFVGIAVAGADGVVDLGIVSERGVPAAVARMLDAFARSGARRARDLSEPQRIALAAQLTGVDWARDSLSAPEPADPRDGLCQAQPPSPLSGGGWPSRQRGPGEGSAVSGEDATRAPSCAVALPLSRPPDGGHPPPQRGEGTRRVRPRAIYEQDSEHGGASLAGGSAPIPAAGLTRLTPHLSILVLDAPFGRCTADALDRLVEAAADLGADEIRLSPARGFVLVLPDDAQATDALATLTADFITTPGDPRRSIAACTGAPACASGTVPTLADAARIAAVLGPLVARGVSIHVSGCAKGCARPGPADLTLAGLDGLYGTVIAGGPGDPPRLRLTIEAALERLGKAGTIGLAAAFAPDEATTFGRDRSPA